MFDNIGTVVDDEANARSAASLMITSGVLAVALGMGLWTTAATLVAIEAVPDDGPMIELVLAEEPDGPGSAPPPPIKGVSKAPDAPPDTMNPNVQPLTPQPIRPIQRQQPTAGVPDGSALGHPDGDPSAATPCVGTDCAPCTGADCEGTGDGGPDVTVFHHSQLQVRRRAPLSYPSEAAAMHLGDQRCKARVFIDEAGRPYDVQVTDCPAAFHPETRAGILKWRWAPPRDGSDRVRAQTVIGVTFQVR